ncbi:lipase family alpha/beta hydrolase [Massilia sp. DWR3-1-1]|uniref:lipase family alpha/beta hydrolase n=1 Tax=Massilia sp. DWR3-1-1 TaxID=2804559 RepID=UPI003CF08FF2
MNSVRRMLGLLLAAQLVALLAVAALLQVYRGWGWPLALLAGAGALLLVRALICTNNFVLSASAASPTPAALRPGLAGWVRLWGEEFAASMLQSCWYGPCGAPRQALYYNHATPVLLLHGYGCNSGYWRQLARRLDAARVSHASVDLAPVTGAIDDYVPQVERAVAALCAATGAARVAIVAHSMGGLVARAWLRRHGSGRLARLITLGSPHHGTVLAQFGVGANAAQMRRSRAGQASAWLRDLDAGETPATRALITSIYTCQDNIVAPQDSSCLDGARQIAVGGVGHVALGRNERVLALVLAELAALEHGAPPSAWTGAPACG